MIELIEYAFFLILVRVARMLSFRTAGAIGSFLGAAAFRCTSFRKAITFDNLSHAFPELPRGALRIIALGAYKNYGRAIVQMLWAGSATEADLRATTTLRNPAVIRDAIGRGKGVILLSAHFGSWELLANAVRILTGIPFTLLVQHQRNARIDRLVDRNRRRFGNTTVPMGPSVREVLTALQQSRVVLMLGDQSGSREALYVEFFGRPAATHRGAASFSLKTGAPIFMLFLIRQPDSTYAGEFRELDRSGLEGYTEKDILELTRRHTAALEQQIRLHPDHWLWMHKRWKHTGYYESQKSPSTALEAAGGDTG